jgi:hypothetical protein
MDTGKSNGTDGFSQRRRIHRHFVATTVFSIALLAFAGLTLWGLVNWSFAEEYLPVANNLFAQGTSSEQVQPSEGTRGEGISERSESGNPVEMPKAEQSNADDIKSRGAQLPHPPPARPLQFQFRPNGAFACIQDNTNMRTLPGPMSQSPTMTNALCRAQCKAGNFVFAGTENGNQCFCGNALGQSVFSNACTMGCSGYNGEVCGGLLANSVSFTGVPPSMVTDIIPKPPILPPPTNGGQCVIDKSGTDQTGGAWRHTEIHRWDRAMGQSVPNTMGPGILIPMNWTFTGNGYYERSGMTSDVRIWTISGAQGVHARVVDQSVGDLLFGPFEVADTILGTLREHQQQWIGGVAQTPGDSTGTRSEIAYGTTLTLKANANPIVAPAYQISVQSYALPGVMLTANCQWNVMR